MNPAIRRLLVPVDLSAGSSNATEHAAVMATALGAAVHLLHVLEEPFVGTWAFSVPDRPHRRQRTVGAEAKLAAIAAGFSRTGATVTTEVRSGRAAREIIAVATERDTDLILMGARGRACSSRATYGSVAEQVVRTAPCPVQAASEPDVDVLPARAGVSTAGSISKASAIAARLRSRIHPHSSITSMPR